VISIRDVYKSYGDVEVLQGCSVEIRKGEVIVVCGPSGSGKSTLIKCVNGLEPFERGEIVVDGVRSASAAPTCPSCVHASAWSSSTSSCSRT